MTPHSAQPRPRHGPFIAALLSTLASLALAAAAWRFAGESLLAPGADGEPSALARLMGLEGKPLPRARFQANRLIHGALAAAGVLVAFAVLAYLTWRGRAPRSVKLAAWLAAWALLELVVAPRMVGAWGLGEFYYVRDPDHRPRVRNRNFNADSLRGTAQPETFRPADWNIVFLGDSFTYGAHLPAEDAFPSRVETLLNQSFAQRAAPPIRVANFGWPSSSPLLSWRRLVEVGENYHPDVVAIAVDMTDFQDDIKYAGMLERRGIFWWSDKTPVLLKLLKTRAHPLFEALKRRLNPELPERRFFMSLAPLEETRPFLRPLVANLDRIHAWCEERGVRFVVFLLPRNYQYSERESPRNWERREYDALGPFALEPFRFFDELAPELDYPVHSLLPTFRDTDVFPTCFDWDPHWNRAGTELAAQAIAERLVPVLEQLGRDG